MPMHSVLLYERNAEKLFYDNSWKGCKDYNWVEDPLGTPENHKKKIPKSLHFWLLLQDANNNGCYYRKCRTDGKAKIAKEQTGWIYDVQ